MIAPVPNTRRPQARHSSKDLQRSLARRIGLAALAVVLFVAAGGAFALHDLQSQVKTVDVSSLVGTARPTRASAKVSDTYSGEAVNILIMGTDSRQGSNDVDDSASTETVARSDTTMVMHISADRKSISVVSIPRDTMVDMPACTSAQGTSYSAGTRQFNSAFAEGAGTGSDTKAIAAGAACTLKTVESMTDVHIDEYVVVDFTGLQKMVNALGGVSVYVDEAIDDPNYTGLILKKGCYLFDGATALKYARVRHGVDDGSDINRIKRQQNLMSAMMRTAKSKNLLTDASSLYSFAKAALGSLTTSPGIGKLTTLAGLAQSIQSTGLDNIEFVTMPNEADPSDANRVIASSSAKGVWKALANDTALPSSTARTKADGTTATAGASATTAATASASASKKATASATPSTNPALQCHN